LLGIEVVDESDVEPDMQALARRQWTKRARALGIVPPEEDPTCSPPPGKAGLTP